MRRGSRPVSVWPRRRSGIGRVLLGSVAERVFAKVTAPVMLVRLTAVATT